jgi:hypothetical protein
MEGLGLRSGEDNAPTGGHREGELDLPVISTGSGAYGKASHPPIRRHCSWPEIAPKTHSTT